MPRIALATYDPGPEPGRDTDLPVLVRALRDAGADAEARHWDDPAADWAGYDLVVIRSTWDYSWRAAEFAAWVERTAALTRLANPAPSCAGTPTSATSASWRRPECPPSPPAI